LDDEEEEDNSEDEEDDEDEDEDEDDEEEDVSSNKAVKSFVGKGKAVRALSTGKTRED